MSNDKLIEFINKQIESLRLQILEQEGDCECAENIHEHIDYCIQLEKSKATKQTLEDIKNIILYGKTIRKGV